MLLGAPITCQVVLLSREMGGADRNQCLYIR